MYVIYGNNNNKKIMENEELTLSAQIMTIISIVCNGILFIYMKIKQRKVALQ